MAETAKHLVVNSDRSLVQCDQTIYELYNEYRHVTVEIKAGNKTTWPMKKTWRMWMGETAEWMAARGATMPLCNGPDGKPWGERPFNAQDAHEMFVSMWLGVDANGERYKTATGDKGSMIHMMDLHVSWCTERGLKLTIPHDSEYMKLKQEEAA